EGKPGEGKPGEGKPGEGKPGEGKPGEGKPGDSGPPEAGQKPLEEAVARQKSAEVKLAEGKKADAKNDQKKALAKMKEALEDLKKERRRIASLPPEEFERLARNQNRTAAQTAKIAEEMKKADESDPSGSKKTPGQSQVKKAQQAMEQASSDLQGEDPEGAEKQQDEAIKELEKALQEIEERLAQLREETQAEKLAKLEARFKEMLILQEEATLQTALLHKKSETEGSLSRTDRIAVAKLASQERALAEMAFQAYEILIEDGTSVVFPHMVDGIRADLELTAEMLEAKRTDRNTQAIQQEVEESLRELIEALQKAKGEKKEGGGGSGGGGKQPLLPNSAELKLLRAEQLRINRRTKRFDRSRPDDGQLDDYLRKEISNLALRQQDIAYLTEQIVERMRRQAAGL
ncbi:MAG: hypothetical protein NXI22_15140, partial [bacterium]|nr:hypothetical protein [bacterium]